MVLRAVDRSPDFNILASCLAAGSTGAALSYLTATPEEEEGFFFFLGWIVDARAKGPEPAVAEDEGGGRLRVQDSMRSSSHSKSGRGACVGLPLDGMVCLVSEFL
jgi:hypothetical protein